jgi:gluconate 5-dehydrogenase
MDNEIQYPNFSLEGKKALVTGAYRGIGRAIALGLANAGATVAVTGRNEKGLAEVAKEIEALDRTAVVKLIDVADQENISRGFEDCANAMDGLDFLVNNAAYENICDALEVTSEIWDAIVNTNLKGAFFCSQAAARLMIKSNGGAIVNICSLASSVGIPTAVPYTSSKSGLLGMTRALSFEWAQKNIRVNGIAPGYVHTPMTDIFFKDPDWVKRMKPKIPVGRFGLPQDMIGATVFLLSDAAQYITGQMITVDGGYIAAI